ncbi:MAG TPA: methyltransferase domain-containing protein [Stellaceae bacterium]|nr:methyltransferase domain-containing protein [Stellaceae bacterium]
MTQADSDSTTAIDANEMLHALRGGMLAEMPRPVETMVSAGCAGSWYFEWIERHYGRVPRHFGFEYYVKRPDDLPDNVVWIEDTCARMDAIPDGGADLVFSGQNIEHLWPDDTAAFLAEASRIVRPGGWIVIDSPNRALTEKLAWRHPEHTVELTPSEMSDLLRVAGFTVTKCVGLWLCRDPADGRVLSFDPNVPAEGWSVPHRIAAARDRPDDSFIWWIEAQRNRAPPDPGAIRRQVDSVTAPVWATLLDRLAIGPGMTEEMRGGIPWIVAAPGDMRIAMFGPYAPMKPGKYRVEFVLDPKPGRTPDGDDSFAVLDVASGSDATVLTSIRARGMDRAISLSFSLEQTTFGVQFRCLSLGKRAFAVRRRVTVTAESQLTRRRDWSLRRG